MRPSARLGSGLGGFARLGVVEAFAVDGGDFGAHAAQVAGELAAMVDAVVHADLHEGDGGKLEDAAEVGDFYEVIAFELRELFEIAREVFGIPGGDFGRRLDAVGQCGGGGKFGVDGGFEEAHFGGGDVAHQVDGGSGTGIRAIVGFAGGDTFENFLGGAAFVLQRAEQEILQPEFGEFGS